MGSKELIQQINKAYTHNPYILKKSLIEIVQFIEEFTKYRMYDQYETVGLSEQLKWESLILIYCELFHSFVDKQRKIYKIYKDLTGLNLDKERNEIINTSVIEHKILIELRNAIHHYAINFTRFSARADQNGKSIPSPNIEWHNVNLNNDLVKYVDKNYFLGGEKLIHLFSNHCQDFISINSKLNIMLLEKISSTKR